MGRYQEPNVTLVDHDSRNRKVVTRDNKTVHHIDAQLSPAVDICQSVVVELLKRGGDQATIILVVVGDQATAAVGPHNTLLLSIRGSRVAKGVLCFPCSLKELRP